MIPFISNLFIIPVTKSEVLKRAKKYKNLGLCYAIGEALRDYNIKYVYISSIFPLFNIEEAKRFGVGCYNYGGFWWPVGNWETGRMDFLNWLIEHYKEDNEDLRKLNYK